MKPTKPPVTVALLRHGGSHLIRPLVKRLARRPIVEPGAHGYAVDHVVGPLIVFLRDPRVRTVSAVRWHSDKTGEPIAPADRDAAVAGLIGSLGYMPAMLDWATLWCHRPDSLVLRYEDFSDPVSGIAQILKIAGYLDVEGVDAPALYRWIWRTSRTVQAVPSDWASWAGPLAEAAWRAGGGDDLVRMLGYE